VVRLSACSPAEISRGLAAGESLRCLAGRLGRAPSTVSRELTRDGGDCRYRAAVRQEESPGQAFTAAVQQWGLPAHVMNDNGSRFTAGLAKNAPPTRADAAIAGHETDLLTARAPADLRQARTLAPDDERSAAPAGSRLQHRRTAGPLDRWREHYNRARPHKAPAGQTLTNKAGHIGWSDYVVGIDRRLAGQLVLVVARDFDLAIYGQTDLLRRLTIDTTRRHQAPASHPDGDAGVNDVLTKTVSDVPRHHKSR
jgi:helix-turn-helix protein